MPPDPTVGLGRLPRDVDAGLPAGALTAFLDEVDRLPHEIQSGILTTVSKVLRDELKAVLDEPACRVCGCTEFDPCEDGCWWVEGDLCSACQGGAAAAS